MRQGSIRLGRILGVPVAVDAGVVIIGAFLTWMLAGTILPEAAPGLVSATYWSVAAVGAVLFLGSLLAHELSHSLIARRNGVEVEGITLWLFGGFAQFKNDPRTAGAEFRISAAGPVTSLLLGAVFVGSAYGLDALGAPAVYVTMLAWLGVINGFLGVFNLLPGSPLDGGRVLAAVLWRIRGDRVAGRIGAARAGKAVGLLIAALGVAEMLRFGGFGGLWTIFIGWFIFNGARSEEAYFVGERALGDLRVRDAMTSNPPHVRTWTTIAELVDGPLRSTSHPAVPVVDWNGTPAGIVTMADVARVPAEQWGGTEVARVLRSDAAVPVVSPDERVATVMEHLEPSTGGHSLVVEDGRLVGMIGPEEIRRAIELGRIRGASPTRRTPPPPPVSVPTQRWEPPLHSR